MPASPISYALPTRENLHSDDDWSRISDRKMKKRLQNRVAQREYRRRTRERIEGLTAQLNEYRRQAHEPRGGSPHEPRSEGDTNRSSSPQEEQEQPPTQPPAQPPAQPPPTQPSPTQPPTQPQSQEQQLHQQRRQHHRDAPELLALADTVNTCAPFTTTIFIPSLLQPSSSASSAVPGSATPQDAGISSPTATRIPSHEMPNMGPGRSAFPAGEPGRTAVSEAPHRDYHHQGDVGFLPIDMDDDGGNEFFDVADNMSTLLTSQSPLAALAQPPPPPDAPMQAPEARAGPGPNRSSASRDRANIWDSLPGANASLEQRFDFLFDWVQHAGFGSLDHLLEVWYTGDFDVSSPLRQEQRLSRHRGLTTLLAKLRGSTHWSKWERWGYQEETLQGAESILRAEFSALISAQCAQFGRLVAAFDARSDRDKHEATRALKRCLQDELPQLRTLLTAVTVDSGKAGRHANRKAIDAATMALSMAGRVSDADLLAILQDVIQNGSRTPEGAIVPGPS